jgi:hypothetical protein
MYLWRERADDGFVDRLYKALLSKLVPTLHGDERNGASRGRDVPGLKTGG